MRRRPVGTRFGIEVPGAYVGLDPYRGGSRLAFWIKNMGVGLLTWGGSAFYSGLAQDVVIRDSVEFRELFREGPLPRSSAILVMNRYADEIREIGLDQFLRRRQIESAQIGPVSVQRIGIVEQTLTYLSGLVEGIFRGRPDDR